MKKNYLSKVVWMCMVCIAHANEEVEALKSVIASKFGNQDAVCEHFISELNKPYPRFYELARRVGVEVNAGAIPEGKKNLYYDQIDGLLDKANHQQHGLAAMRVITIVSNEPRVNYYWHKDNGDKKAINLTKFIRKVPANAIDITDPLDEWLEEIGKSTNLSNVDPLLKLFNDPMPPTSIPATVRQGVHVAAIGEAVIMVDGKLKYLWFIRSSYYTSGYDEYRAAIQKALEHATVSNIETKKP